MTVLHEPGEAFAYVGAEDFCFFKCYTGPLTNKTNGEPGRFDTEYRALEDEFKKSRNQQMWLMVAARRVVTHAAQSTRTPLEAWVVEFSPMLAYLNIPSHLFLSNARDRQWLGL